MEADSPRPEVLEAATVEVRGGARADESIGKARSQSRVAAGDLAGLEWEWESGRWEAVWLQAATEAAAGGGERAARSASRGVSESKGRCCGAG